MITYPNIDPILISIGPLHIRWYGLAYIAGLMLPFYILKSAFKDQFYLSTDDQLNFLSYLIFGVLIGGRLGYVLFYDIAYYLTHPLSIFEIWRGGMSYHGGAIGTIVATILFAKNYSLPILSCLDFLAFGSTIGIFFGRLANFINGELYGRITSVSWGMIFPNGGPLPRHPSQLYEAFFEGFILFFILFLVHKKQWLKPGQLICVYTCCYGFFRFFIEFFRQPDVHLGTIVGPFSMGQLLCLFMIVLGSSFFPLMPKIQARLKKR